MTPGVTPRLPRRSTRGRALVLGVAAALVATLVSTSPSGPAAATTANHRTRDTHHHTRHHVRHESVKVSRTFFGIHDGSTQAYGRVPFGSLRLWDAGVTWKNLETAPGVFDWTRLDSLVTQAQDHDVQVTLVLGMTPSFYASAPNQAPVHLADYARYVRAVMERYRDFNGSRGIYSYQVWNEGNVKYFWTDTPQKLAELTRIVNRVRNHVDPQAKVLAPSFAVRMGYQQRWLSAYQTSHVGGRPVWRDYDINALSIYPKPTYDGRPGGPEDAMRLVDESRRRLAAAGVPASKKLWATEINFGVVGGDVAQAAATPISEEQQVANVLRTYLLGAAHGLDRVFWYRYDWNQIAGGGTLGNTLLSVPGQSTEVTDAGRALWVARRWLRGRLVATGRHHEPCAHGSRGTYRCTVRFAHGARTIMWNPHRVVRVRLPQTTSSGRVLARTQDTLQVGYQPVMVRTSR